MRRGRSPSRRISASFFLLSRQHGREPEGVPAFFLCDRMVVGFDSADGVGAELRSIAEDCKQRLAAPKPESETAGLPAPNGSAAPRPIDIPLIGTIDPRTLSLPVLTLLLAGLDAFNPCAFFVLLFLLSLMVHARSRARMALVGGTFVAISGLMYFLFMAAWLNLFLVLENVGWVTRAAGLVAVAVGLLGVNDFFSSGEKPTMSVSEAHKESLYARTRALISAENMAALLAGTVALAIAANMYELICTSGFPLVYTRVLTLNALPVSANYAYLALYNVIYVLPLLAIVALFVWTLGSRKLGESEGRALKLLSGLIMLSMGVTLIVAPEMFDNPLPAAGVLAAAAGVTGLVVVFRRRRATGNW